MLAMDRQNMHGEEIVVLGPYRPWNHHKSGGGDHGSYPEHSRRILDLKDGKEIGIDYFYDYMSPRIKTPYLICTVPSHDPQKVGGGLPQLAARLAAPQGRVDGISCLIRATKIAKLAEGGDRSINVHLDSIRAARHALIEGRPVLLIDDVMTTGHSMLACKKILMDAGAERVACVALGRTTY